MPLLKLLTEPEFYDIFGIFAFAFITYLSFWMLQTNKKPVKWAIIILLLIGIAGLIVDGIIVYVIFIK